MTIKSIILVIDAGSSSVRCTAHEYHGVVKSFNRRLIPPLDTIHDIASYRCCRAVSFSSTSSSPDASSASPTDPPPPLVDTLKDIGHTIQLAAIIPSTGHVRVQEVLNAIDKCVDETLRILRHTMMTFDSASDEGAGVVGGQTFRIVAVGFSTFVMNLVAVDIYGKPVGDVATCSYACNREDVVDECERLRAELGKEKLDAMYQRTGTPLHVSYALPQLRAFYANPKNQPLAKQIDKWQTLSTICLNRWLGSPCIQMPISYSEASWTGMFDFRSCSWDDEASNLLETCPGITCYEEEFDEEDKMYKDEHIELLPPLADFDTLLPILKEGVSQFNSDGSDNVYWQNWPEFRAHTLSLFLGIGDGAAANIGTKCGPGQTVSTIGERPQQRIAVTIGTSAAARVCLPLPSASAGQIHVPAGLFCYRVDRDTILLGGALTDGGSVVEWARSLLNLQSPESFDACMTQVADMYNERCSRSSQGVDVTMVPFLSGERSTGYRTGARACISGLTRDSTSNDFMYASLESVVLRLGQVLRLISEACATQRLLRDATNVDGANVENILVASGTALERNPLWRRMLADCTSLDVIVDGDSAEEATSRGVAMLLAESLQESGQCNKRVYGDIEQPLVVVDETIHNPIAEEHWNKRLKSQETVLDAIASVKYVYQNI